MYLLLTAQHQTFVPIKIMLMKNIGLLLSLILLACSLSTKVTAQNLACNDLVYFSLDENCSHTIVPDEILEGINWSDCIVEIDKTAPSGNGPWEPGILGPADIGKTYIARVVHVPSGNTCFGNIKIEDKLPPMLICNELSVVEPNTGPIATNSLSITATDACGAVTLSPNSVEFECLNVGINTVQITATDPSGNSSTCDHSIMVSTLPACAFCLGSCPSSLTVDYDLGNSSLLPAFQNNNWAAFDVFGNGLFDPACGTYSDSTYSISIVPSPPGQGWFSREWVWTLAPGITTTCQQIIAYPTTHTVVVEGKVYIDTNDDCLPDAGEQAVSHYGVLVTMVPSGATVLRWPDANGNYEVPITFGTQDVSAELQLLLPNGLNPVCPTALSIPNSTAAPLQHFDIGLQSSGNCPVMEVTLSNGFLRRCAANAFSLQYCNSGLDTAYGAFVTVDFDSLITILSATKAYTVSGPNDLITFQLGDIAPFQCGSITIIAEVSCSAELGQTLCSDANIYPDESCGGSLSFNLEAKAVCLGDSVELVLKNKGPQDMAVPLNYIVIEDFIMYRADDFQLDAGDSIIIKTPANGATWRIESALHPNSPITGIIAAAIEGCGGLNTPGVVNAYSSADESLSYDQYCNEIRGSFDPNDKTAVPTGVGAEHVIRANEGIEYKIRFQNTGTDTAFRVVIVDTLSNLLDYNGFEAGASSHPYKLKIFPNGIVHFVFDPIALPDSNINEVASHGFVQFRITQQPDLPDGTRIENTAAIYFDQNEAVITNTAFHTIGYPFQILDPLGLSVGTQLPSCYNAHDGGIQLSVSGGLAPYSFHWGDSNLQGDTLTGLSAGTYQLTLTDSHGNEIVQEFEITDPAPILLALSATPATGNNNNGTASAVASGGTGTLSYLWSTGAGTAEISNLAPGTYTVVVSDQNGCTSSDEVVVEQSVGTIETANKEQIRVWPNPAHDKINVDLQDVLQLTGLDVLNAEGRLLMRLGSDDLRPQLTLNLEEFQTGVVVFLVFHGSDGFTFTQKVVIR
jgi:uncharacterized repeat protein (TIGR01451 family)